MTNYFNGEEFEKGSEVVNDGTEGSHTATWDWYTIDVNTMKGEDFFGNPVDLSK